MRKLIKITNVSYLAVDEANNLRVEGTPEAVGIALENVGISDQAVDDAIMDMARTDNNVADFGGLRGEFLFSAFLTKDELADLLG